MSNLVLITGVTGHVGFAVLVEALQKGHTVRAAVRRESAIDELTSEAVIQQYLSQLTFVVVPDLTVPDAFKEVLDLVTHVIHIASPLPKPGADPEKEVIGPAVSATTGILQSALKIPSIRKVIITSSVAAIRSSDAKPTDMIHPDGIVAEPEGPYSDPFTAYGASKVRAHSAVLKFIATKQPHFSVINIMPAFVIGPNRLAKTPEQVNSGSNAVVLGLLLGGHPPYKFCQMVHVDDVAFAHVAAIDDAIQGVHNFGLAYNGYTGGADLNQATDIVRTHFVDEVRQGILPLGGSAAPLPSYFDTRRTEEAFNFKQKNFETMVLDLAAYYLKIVRETHS